MLFCLNPDCSNPNNPDSNQLCHGCGQKLADSTQSYDFRLRYRVVKLLGQGGFGRTYAAKDLDFYERPCVIKKFIAPIQAAALEKAKELFAREAKRLYTLNHSQIPQLYAYFEHNNGLYLVQELIEGENLLEELFQKGTFNEEQIRELLQDTLPILQYLHSQNVLHRDIKPDNIMRRRNPHQLSSSNSEREEKSKGRFVLIDFGGSKEIMGTILSSPSTTIYTPGYASPEQLMGRPIKASDLYSLGATCVRLLTGCLTTADQDGRVQDLIYDVHHTGWQWSEYLQEKGIYISDRLKHILDKLLEHYPKNRYQSAEEVIRDLRKNEIPAKQSILSSIVQNLISTLLGGKSLKALNPKQPNISTQTTVQVVDDTPNYSKSDSNLRDVPYFTTSSQIRRGRFLELLVYSCVGAISTLVISFLWGKYRARTPFSTTKNLEPLLLPEAENELNSILSPQPETNLPNAEQSTKQALKVFTFPVILVNARGEEIDRYERQAQFLNFELGNDVTIDFVSIPEGKFLMGSPVDEEGHKPNESPQRQIQVSSLFVGKYPVTQAQWQAVMKSNPSSMKILNLPVESVSWHDCVQFCEKVSSIIGQECRLPSEAEWEYACRAGTTTPFHFGETLTTDLANYNGNYIYSSGSQGIYRAQMTQVGSFPANAFGLYDMHGQVWEWCADTWYENYQLKASDGSAWLDEAYSQSRLVRGGSWVNSPNQARSAYRRTLLPSKKVNNIGFRVVFS